MWRGIPKQTPLPFLRSMTKIRLPRMRSTALHGRFPIRLLAEPAIPLYTNLDSETFPIGTVKELYRLRWGIETSFRELKYTIGLSCLHGKKTDFLLQEVLKMLYTQTVLAFARKTTAGVWTFFWTYLM
ncbi:MAG: transposase [Dysosmobacter sp.]|uniref:transposase n=1 Tax=Dysosmobacter sp. TaxID=2591382 RepID=UPI003A2757B4